MEIQDCVCDLICANFGNTHQIQGNSLETKAVS